MLSWNFEPISFAASACAARPAGSVSLKSFWMSTAMVPPDSGKGAPTSARAAV
jgi:hypothetical protein